MRGVFCFRHFNSQHIRFIPACAGFSRRSRPCRPRCAVHPRMRGFFGRVFRRASIFTRFIPACAGFSIGALIGTPVVSGSSPHARGFLLPPPREVAELEVHPRMRGVFNRHYSKPFSDVRFIPACAGFSVPLWDRHSAGTVHPRMRGVFKMYLVQYVSSFGSSPHARGFHLFPP